MACHHNNNNNHELLAIIICHHPGITCGFNLLGTCCTAFANICLGSASCNWLCCILLHNGEAVCSCAVHFMVLQHMTLKYMSPKTLVRYLCNLIVVHCTPSKCFPHFINLSLYALWCCNLLTKHLLQCEVAKQEVLSLVSQTLIKNFPDRFQLKETTLRNIATGEDFDLADQDRNPMDVVARLVQVRQY